MMPRSFLGQYGVFEHRWWVLARVLSLLAMPARQYFAIVGEWVLLLTKGVL